SIMTVQYDASSQIVSIFSGDEPLVVRTSLNKYEEQNNVAAATAEVSDIDKEFLMFDDVSTQEADPALLEYIYDIERLAKYYIYSINSGQKEIDAIFVVGDHPKREQFAELLSAMLNIPQLLPKDRSGSLPIIDSEEHLYATCIGLALKQK
ncbi:MAG: hypothetical protein ACRCWQ_15175, partial [Bacilli bacterium]